MRRLLILGILVITTLGLAGSAKAYDVSAGDQTSLSANSTTSGTYYAAGNTINIDGTVKGDVFCAGQNVTINGPVSGDVICAAQNITINGPVAGSVRLAAQTVSLNGNIGRNASVLSQTLVTSKDSAVSGELMAQAGSVTLNGTIGGETYGNAARLSINGQVDGNVRYAAQTVVLGSTAKIGGNLDYTSSQQVAVATGATITGTTKQTTPKVPDNQRQNAQTAQLAGFLFNLLSALVLGALLIWFAPRFIRGASAQASRPGLTMLLGFAALILVPIAAVMIMFTIIGIPAGILGLIIWGVALFLSRIVAALAFGTVLYRLQSKGKLAPRPYAAGALGILAAYLIFALPFVGGFASFLAILYGLGVMVYALRDHIDREEAVAQVKVATK
jgi:cytoskeletal protein CcmA (bactofilin family)